MNVGWNDKTIIFKGRLVIQTEIFRMWLCTKLSESVPHRKTMNSDGTSPSGSLSNIYSSNYYQRPESEKLSATLQVQRFVPVPVESFWKTEGQCLHIVGERAMPIFISLYCARFGYCKVDSTSITGPKAGSNSCVLSRNILNMGLSQQTAVNQSTCGFPRDSHVSLSISKDHYRRGVEKDE